MRARQEDSGETQEGGASRASSWEPGTCLPWVESSKRGMTSGGLSTTAGNRSVIWGGPLMDIFHLEKCILVKTPLALQTHDLGFWFYFFLIEISIISNCEGFAASQACC